MEIEIKGNLISLEKELNELDKFVIRFTKDLDSYCIVGGYVSILFGRSRVTEDIDIPIPEDNISKILKR